MSAVDAVVFDFGNVLAMVNRPVLCAALARNGTLNAAQVDRAIWGTDIERRSETGAWDAREHWRRLSEALGARDWTFEQFQRDFIRGFTLNEEGIRAMRLARSRGKRVFVLSNTSYSHARWLFDQEELVSLPEGHIFSFKVGVMKPDSAIWRHLLETRCLRAERCVYVDDVPAFCEAASRLGFRTINYVRGKTDLETELGLLLRD